MIEVKKPLAGTTGRDYLFQPERKWREIAVLWGLYTKGEGIKIGGNNDNPPSTIIIEP